MAVEILRRRFTVDQYHRMAEAGVLTEGDRVELIEGEIVEMTPIGSRHAAAVDRLNALVGAALRGRAIVRVQNPVRLGARSEPQPDLAVLRLRVDFYAGAHPGAGDVLLVVEVADASLDYDRAVKLPLYARAGIPEAWLVDVERPALTVHRAPSADGYRDVREARAGERLTLVAFPETSLAVDDCLG